MPSAARLLAYRSDANLSSCQQKGAVTSSSTLSAEDVVRMVKYSRFVEDAIALFETKVVSRVKTRGHRSEEYYGPGAVGHPPHLTRTERPRFISAYYRLWGLMKSKDAAERQSRLESMTLKQLVHLYELSTLPYSIGSGGEAIMPPRDPDAEPGPIFATSHRTLRVWAALERQILAHLDQIYQHIHGTKLNPIWANAGNKGLIGFLTIWDHWQPSLKEFICGRRRKEPPYRKVLHLELWEDSSGEE
ncbi:MAG: hypothetical protein L6R39_002145 [Caloplaca ligustica]|nr:MAG: hypothetical protein L6R39_002145 [Caloplaca ligustica]